jgi:hypothetical protein
VVIGHTFAWAHFPKTGGEATRGMFRLFPELLESVDASDYPRKHETFEMRGIDDKVRVANIRRLPAWRVSMAHELAEQGKPKQLQIGPKAWLVPGTADRPLVGLGPIDRWLRSEYLADDFLAFISELTDVSEERRGAVRQIGVVNARAYDHDLERWFSEDDVRALYDLNPVWAAVEKQVYGSLVYGAVVP